MFSGQDTLSVGYLQAKRQFCYFVCTPLIFVEFG